VTGPESFWEVTFGPYLNLLGGYFWAIVLFMIVALVYIKTKSLGPTALMLIVGSSILGLSIPGDVQILFIFGIAFGVTLVFYQLLVRRKAW